MRLNIGCGPVQPTGWVNMDTDERWANAPGPEHFPAGEFVLMDRGATMVSHHRGGADGAVAHHVLQMIAWPELIPWLDDVRSVLDPGAWLRVSVPDFPAAYVAALDGDRDWFPIADEIESSIDGKLVCYLTQCGATRSLFTGPWLEDLLRRAGFVGVHTTSFGQTAGPEWLVELDSRPSESLFIEGAAP